MSFSLSPHGKGKWRVKVSLGYDPASGRYPQRSRVIEASGVREARALAEEWAESLSDSRRTGVATFGDLCNQYYATKATRWRPSTVDNVGSMLRTHFLPQLGDVALPTLDRRVISAWQDQHQGSDNHRSNLFRQMRSILKWAAKTGRMTYSHSQECIDAMDAVPRVKKDAPDRDSVRRILQAASGESDQTYNLIRTALVTGARRAELAGLQIGDYDPEAGTLSIRRSFNKRGELASTKTKKPRTVDLDDRACEVLDRQVAAVIAYHRVGGMDVRPSPDWPMFLSRTGGHLPLSTITHTMARLRTKAGLPDGSVWMHGLRHTTATEARAAGVDPLYARDRMGHTSLEMTDAYTSTDLEARKSAARLIGARIDSIED